MGRDGEPGSLAGEPARVSRLANGAADGESLAQLDAGRRKPMLIQTDGGTDRREQGAFHTARAQRRRRAAQTPAPGRWVESRRRLRPSTSVGRLPLRRPARSNLRCKKSTEAPRDAEAGKGAAGPIHARACFCALSERLRRGGPIGL